MTTVSDTSVPRAGHRSFIPHAFKLFKGLAAKRKHVEEELNEELATLKVRVRFREGEGVATFLSTLGI